MKQAYKIIIDGRKLSDKYSGVERYASEVLKGLDRLLSPHMCCIILKPEFCHKYSFQNIDVIPYIVPIDKLRYLEILLRVIVNDAVHIDFFNGFAIGRRSLVTIHDIFPFFGVSGSSWIRVLFSKLRAHQSAFFSEYIITVSEYSEKAIISRLHVSPKKILIIPNGWQHIANICPDDSILRQFKLRSKRFYLFTGRLVKNKNIQWIFKMADNNSDDVFVITGALQSVERFTFYKGSNNNIIYTGYISDEKLVSLYINCKAFLFPSIMEGFGIPPMEALYYGAPIIISNTSSLPEIYGDTAHYIDPYRYDYNLDEILAEPVGDPQKVLDNYSWEKSVKMWYELIESIMVGDT